MPFATLEIWQHQPQQPLTELAGFAISRAQLVQPRQVLVNVGVIAGPLFRTLGSVPIRGRTLIPSSGMQPEAVLSRSAWADLFASRPDIVGQSLTFQGSILTVVGVVADLPGEMAGVDIWIHRGSASLATALDQYFVVGRAISAQSMSTARHLASALPPGDSSRITVTVPFATGITTTQHQAQMDVALGSLVVMFLIGCINLAGVFASRAIKALPEIEIRQALGASRKHLIGTAISEIAVVSAGAATLSLTATIIFRDQIQALVSSELGVLGYAFHWATVLAVMAACTLALGIISVAPALLIARHRTVAVKSQSLREGTATRNSRSQAVILAGETALSVVLVIGALLLSKSYASISQYDIGFDPSRIVSASVDPNTPEPKSTAVLNAGMQALEALSKAFAGNSAMWHQIGISRTDGGAAFTRQGRGETPTLMTFPPVTPSFGLDVSPGFFEVLGIPVVAGRPFTMGDNAGAPRVVILNKIAADGFWPGQSPIGKMIKLGPVASNSPWMRVIGVVGNTPIPTWYGFLAAILFRQHGTPLIFRPLAQTGLVKGGVGTPYLSDLHYVVRTEPQQARIAARTIDSVIAGTFPNGIAEGAMRMDSKIKAYDRFQRVRAVGGLLQFVALLGVILMAVGFLTQSTEWITRRRRELAIRAALGATPSRLFREITGRGVRLAAISVTAGLALAFILRSFLAPILDGSFPTQQQGGMLYGVTSLSWYVYAGGFVLTIVLGVIAAGIPAARFVRDDPQKGIALSGD